MTLKVKLKAGQSIFEQVVYAAQKALVSGEFQPGQKFPSVRALAADLKIHPNTAHKVIQHLIRERLLEARPGIGTIVAQAPRARSEERRNLLKQELEQLVVEAKRVGVSLEELNGALKAHWNKLESAQEIKSR